MAAASPSPTDAEAESVLRFTHVTDPLYADLAELMIGTGIRKGEALALHWDDVHLPERAFFVRATPSVIDRSSKAWVALSDRVGTRAFGSITPAGGYVFHRHGRHLHSKNVLDRFHLLCDEAGVPCIALHDLRHLTASFATAAGVPLPVSSKTLRTAPCPPARTSTPT
ncbi:tyrosine-type recombinase/integrase [Kitasatospora sp. NBC_00458]|uniref:tyrosine-type recombinase/integrase n=1 Tax=Kitasatospora sp. NBC_00458 TaxID=2903568 RepID=UPI002E16C8A7